LPGRVCIATRKRRHGGEDCRRLSIAKGEPRRGLATVSLQVHTPPALPDGNGAAYNRRMASRRLNEPIEPMTLGNMRANGVRSLDVCCWVCHHRTILSADPWSDDVPVLSFGARMVCMNCGIIGAAARLHWHEQPPRESLTGVQWR
jgi:hypothetical protein